MRTPAIAGTLGDMTDHTTQELIEHMIGGATAFAPAFRGDSSPAASLAGSPQERFHVAMAELGGAVHAPGAQDRTISAPFGDVPGAMFARYVAFDGLVHGWDLATTTGQSYTPSDALIVEVDTFARSLIGPEMRDGDTFADAPLPTTYPSMEPSIGIGVSTDPKSAVAEVAGLLAAQPMVPPTVNATRVATPMTKRKRRRLIVTAPPHVSHAPGAA